MLKKQQQHIIKMELPLTNSDKKVLVDPDVYEKFKDVRLHLNGWGYAQFWDAGGQCSACLHKHVMGNPKSEVDHIDGNKLDCRRCNLRSATHSQNMVNKPKRRGNYSSKYIGVYFNKRCSKWYAQYTIMGKTKTICYFDDEVECAKVRDRAIAQSALGLYAQMNFPDEPYVFKLQYDPVYS